MAKIMNPGPVPDKEGLTMAIPKALELRLKVPVIQSPMFLASSPELVAACCRAGVLGTFPALNLRSTDALRATIVDVRKRLSDEAESAPFGVNLVVHKSNRRLEADLDVICAERVPVVITSLGAVPELVDRIQAYGGLVFHDVINRRFAVKAAQAGVDGIIAVSAGAGGHAGTINPFALLAEIRAVYGGCLILGGALNSGADIAAARMAGADLAYMGTRFLATKEAAIVPDFKQMIVESDASDILYTPAISGVGANFMRPSLLKAGLDPENFMPLGKLDIASEAKAWRDVWSAGQGVAGITEVPSAKDLCHQLIDDYRAAIAYLSDRDDREGFGA